MLDTPPELLDTIRELRRSEERLRLITDNLPALVSYVGLDGRYQMANAAYERWFGLKTSQIVGSHVRDVLGADYEQRRPYIDAVLAGKLVHFEAPLHHRLLGRRECLLTYIPHLDATGTVVGFSMMCHDVTDLKEMQRQLAERNEQLEQAVRVAGIGFFDHNLLTHKVQISARLRRDLGFAPDQDVTFEMIAKQIHPADRDQFLQRVQQHWDPSGDGYFAYESRRVLPDGRTRWISTRGQAFFEGEGAERRAVRVIGANLDVTESKENAERLLEADRRKDEFLATLAHELRNPLAPIRSAVQFLMLQEPSDPRLRQACEIIDRQVGHLVHLVDDLLDVSRVAQGRVTLHRRRVDIATVLANAVESSMPAIEAAQHHLEIIAAPTPLYVDADLTRLAQVFLNLLNNAAKYTPRGGHIELRTERSGDEVRVTVRDDGIGIAPEQLPRVFEMFVQLGRPHDPARTGLGIGLALCRQLVHMHGGSIHAHSEGAGRGSRFSVSLPLAPPP
jgi:PAS domain S-box-containing protein